MGDLVEKCLGRQRTAGGGVADHIPPVGTVYALTVPGDRIAGLPLLIPGGEKYHGFVPNLKMGNEILGAQGYPFRAVRLIHIDGDGIAGESISTVDACDLRLILGGSVIGSVISK